MNIRFFRTILLFVLCAGGITLPAQETETAEKIAVDTDFLIGKLDNGLTYYIRKATNPAKSAEFYIVHNVGSLQEEESQRGLAHFLEHMAFNGTKNFPDKNMLNSLAAIGVKFGANVNAYTSMDRTVYNISAVPMLRSSITDSVLLMLHDWSSYISCEPEEIEAERGVVTEEWRRGDEPRTRMIQGINELEYTGSRFAERRVIGLPQIIASFSRETLIDYYHKWYRPDLQAVIVVGDIDPTDIEQRIKRIFYSIPAPKESAAKREVYPMPANGKPIIGRYSDPELKAISVRFAVRFPLPDSAAKQTVQSIKEKLIVDLITDMIGVRCAVSASGKDAGFKNVIPTNADTYYAWRNFKLTAIPQGNNLEKAMTGILKEYEKMLRYGFSESELTDAKISKKIKIGKDEKRYLKAKNSDYVNMAVEAYTRNASLYDIPAYYKTMYKVLDRITTKDIEEFMSKNFGYKNMVLTFSGSNEKHFSSDERMYAIMDSLQKAPMERYNHISKNELAFNYKLGPVSIDSKNIKEFGMISQSGKQICGTQIEMPGNIKIIHVSNPLLDNKETKMYAVRKGGYSAEPDSTLHIARMTGMCLASYTPNSIDRNDFNRYMSNNSLHLQKKITATHDIIEGYFATESADKFFKTLYLTANNSGFAKGAFNEYKNRLVKEYSKKSGSKIFADSCTILRYNDNGMLKRLTLEQIEQFTEQQATTTYNRHFSDISGMTFIFESNGLSLEDIKPYFEKYIANMNTSNNSINIGTDRTLHWKKGEKELKYYDSQVAGSKASVNAQIFSTFKFNNRNIITARYLTYLLREYYTRTIREERGGSYTISVEEELFSKPFEYITYTISFDTNAQLVEELAECVWDAFKEFADNGPSEESIHNIKLYYAKFAKERKELNKSVIKEIVASVTGEKTANPFDENIIEEITAKDVQKFAKSILKQKNFSTFIYLPRQ